ncbi:MAG: glycosyltransferase [Dysgonamonadaceae bacterium]|jgi:glycosyltransferase involved in cell wall biosynthesis|nr:glycosyltransferase [Dysgonamonadaceae bacterium]
MFYSVIIPVYNRPNEVEELLCSLERQTYKNFEVIIVEDGSSIPCEAVVRKYAASFPIQYFYKPNSGPGLSRNFGAGKSKGDYLIFFDSDCIIPENYLKEVETQLSCFQVDAFGGPDKADKTFSKIQKAINYSMTSFFTTGGIRGDKKRMDKFHPRSFNLGIRKSVFEALEGFSAMRFGEDIDLSIRLMKAGYHTCLFSEAWVYHKRRTGWKKFFKQVYNSGVARINLYAQYPETLKPVYMLPALFTAGLTFLLIGSFFYPYALAPVFLFCLLIFIDSAKQTQSLSIGILSVAASFVQLTGYGSGFLIAYWQRFVLKRDYKAAFEQTFYN